MKESGEIMSKVHIIEYQVYFGSIPVYNEERNTQSIKEALMREAVKQCDCYSTDLLVFFDNTWRTLIKGDIAEVTLYFKQSGIDWKNQCDKCRSIATLKRNLEKDTLELTIDYGVC